MSKKYAVVNKESKIVENIIVWDGVDTNIIPSSEEWINISDDNFVTIGFTYLDGQFHKSSEWIKIEEQQLANSAN